MQKQIRYREINIKIIRKKSNKNLVARAISENTIKISAPYTISDNMVKEFIDKKFEKIKSLMKREQNLSINLSEKTEIRLFSKKYKILNLTSDKNSIIINKNIILIFSSKNTTLQQKNEMFEKFLKNMVLKEAKEIVSYYEKIMDRKINSIRIKKLKSRWGSINVKTKNMNLNYELIFFEKKCLEYVIVHEIAHLYEKSHNKNFYEVVKLFYPGYKDINKMLKAKEDIIS